MTFQAFKPALPSSNSSEVVLAVEGQTWQQMDENTA